MTKQDIEDCIKSHGYYVSFPEYVSPKGDGTTITYVSVQTRVAIKDRITRSFGKFEHVASMSRDELVKLIERKFASNPPNNEKSL